MFAFHVRFSPLDLFRAGWITFQIAFIRICICCNCMRVAHLTLTSICSNCSNVFRYFSKWHTIFQSESPVSPTGSSLLLQNAPNRQCWKFWKSQNNPFSRFQSNLKQRKHNGAQLKVKCILVGGEGSNIQWNTVQVPPHNGVSVLPRQ